MSKTKEFLLIIGMFSLLGGMLMLLGYLMSLEDRGIFQVTFSDGRKLVCRIAAQTPCGMLYSSCDDKAVHRCTINSEYTEIK